MFRLFTFKQLVILSVFLCFILLLGTALNIASPFVAAFSDTAVAVPIIMYHQISENRAIWGDYVIPPSVLKNDFEYIKQKGYTPISFEELKGFVQKGGALPQKPIIITFDDGERSFLTKVLPLLEEYNFPANINVVGSLIELYTKNGETDDSYAYLNASDIKLLCENDLVTLGCHSYNMHSLSTRRGMGKVYAEGEEEYIKAVRSDIEAFNKLVKKITGRELCVFAYPYGIRNNILQEIVTEYGYEITLTCGERVNKLSVGSHLYELGRFNRPYGKTSEEFFEGLL